MCNVTCKLHKGMLHLIQHTTVTQRWLTTYYIVVLLLISYYVTVSLHPMCSHHPVGCSC